MSPGELAALGTATCWTASSLTFEAAARRIGSLSLNLIRVVAAFGWLAIAGWLLRGRALPTDATAAQWGWLTLSGLVGMTLGDLCTFRAYVEIGARRTAVISTSTPIFAAALGWIGLGERVTAVEALGMVVIVLGVALAVSGRASDGGHGRTGRGVLLALGGSLGQAGGLLLSKHGLAGYPVVPATQIRVLAGIAGFAVVLTVARWWRNLAGALHDGRALGYTTAGALLGPCIGVALSLYAVTHAHAGVAASIMSTTPILIIPIVIARGERVGLEGVIGAACAVAGVALLAAA